MQENYNFLTGVAQKKDPGNIIAAQIINEPEVKPQTQVIFSKGRRDEDKEEQEKQEYNNEYEIGSLVGDVNNIGNIYDPDNSEISQSIAAQSQNLGENNQIQSAHQHIGDTYQVGTGNIINHPKPNEEKDKKKDEDKCDDKGGKCDSDHPDCGDDGKCQLRTLGSWFILVNNDKETTFSTGGVIKHDLDNEDNVKEVGCEVFKGKMSGDYGIDDRKGIFDGSIKLKSCEDDNEFKGEAEMTSNDKEITIVGDVKCKKEDRDNLQCAFDGSFTNSVDGHPEVDHFDGSIIIKKNVFEDNTG